MAAGLGFKDFVTGEVLTAADVDGYLMQGVWVFASAAARDAAVTSPQEGNFAYLKDTNVTTYYTGSAWANLDTTGMTNPMTTTGDTIYSSSGSTPARLGIGSTGQVLTVAGGVPSWATPSGGSFVGCLVTRSPNASQSIPDATATNITFSSETYDTDGFHSTSTNTERITIPSGKGGYYLVYATFPWVANSTGRRLIYAQLNGSGILQSKEGWALQSAAGCNVDIMFVRNFSAGDYITIQGWQSSGGNLDAGSGDTAIYFGVVKLG